MFSVRNTNQNNDILSYIENKRSNKFLKFINSAARDTRTKLFQNKIYNTDNLVYIYTLTHGNILTKAVSGNNVASLFVTVCYRVIVLNCLGYCVCVCCVLYS